MNLKNINYVGGKSVVFSSIEIHSAVDRHLKITLGDLEVSGAGFVSAEVVKGVDHFLSYYKSTSMDVDSDDSLIEISDYKYLTVLDYGYCVISNFKISDESIELKNIRFETIEGFCYDKGVLLSDDTDTAVVNWLETIHFDSWYGFYNY